MGKIMRISKVTEYKNKHNNTNTYGKNGLLCDYC